MTDTNHDATAGRLPLGDRARLSWALLRVSMHLEGRVSKRRWRAIREELRSNVHAAAAERGGRAAVAGLGDLRVLAAGYAEAESSPVRWWAGTLASQITLVVGLVAQDIFHAGFTAGVRATGSDGAFHYSYELWEGFGPLRGSADPAGGAFDVVLGTPFLFVSVVLAYVIFARLWRWRPGQ